MGNANKVSSVIFKPRLYVSTGLWVGSRPRPYGAQLLVVGSATDV